MNGLQGIWEKGDYEPFMARLENVFEKMDAAYDKAAEHYGFQCRGCPDNCCETLFFHHTLLEFFFLRKGFAELDDPLRKDLTARAGMYIREMDRPGDRDSPFRTMCPANVDGLCTLYRFRPMICRLHGVSHELKKPGLPPVQSPGCAMFMKAVGDSPPVFMFDRTPHYRDMAMLEKELRDTVGFRDRIRLTVAQILIYD